MSREMFTTAQQEALDRHGVSARSRFVPVPSVGGEAHVVECGEGHDVVLLAGIGLPAAFWAPLLAELRGCRVHAVDMPGFGLTDTPPDWGSDVRRDAVRFIDEIVDGLGIERPVTLIANSLGSLWASWFALERPDDVRAMVHVACPALVLGTSAPLPMRMLGTRLGPLLMRLQPPSPKGVERLGAIVGEDLASQPVMRDLLLAAERLPDHGRMMLTLLPQLVRLRGARPAMALGEDDLGRIRVPVQVVWADGDPFGSVDVGERMVAALPDAELRVVPGGHAPWLDSAATIADHIGTFLDTRVHSEADRR